MKKLSSNLKNHLQKLIDKYKIYICNIKDLMFILLAFTVVVFIVLYVPKDTHDQETVTEDVHTVKVEINPEHSMKENFYLPNELPESNYIMDSEVYNLLNSDEKESEVEEDGFYYYAHIPLQKKTQRYIEKTSRENELSPELVYAVAYVETGGTFNNKLVTSEGSYSMFQIHKPSGTFEWLAKTTVAEYDNINKFNYKNPIHSSTAAIWYLKYLREYWLNKGYSEEDVFALSVGSYNMGIGNMNDYIQSHDPYDWYYVQKVLDYKVELEKERYQ